MNKQIGTKRIKLSNIIQYFVIISLCIYANYYALLNKLFNTNTAITLLPTLVILLLLLQLIYGKKIRLYNAEIICFGFLLLISGYNQEIAHGSYYMTVRLVCSWLIVTLLSQRQQFEKKIVNMLIVIGFPNVLATIFLYFFPRLYDNTLYPLYGFYPTGTNRGLYIYRAGLADHYSQNGIFISIVFLALVAHILYCVCKKQTVSFFYWTITAITAIAFLLTGKRAVLVFVTLAIITVYYICVPSKLVLKTLRIASVGLLILVIGVILSKNIPALAVTIQRFSEVGDDKSYSERLAMLNLAWSLFLSKPLFGIGTFGFRYKYFDYLFGLFQANEVHQYLNAHNVYIQLLCENGILGLIIFLTVVILNLKNTLKIFRYIQHNNSGENKSYIALIFSLLMQVFFLEYCMTGNCLYDVMFCFYCIASAIPYAVKRRLQNNMKGAGL